MNEDNSIQINEDDMNCLKRTVYNKKGTNNETSWQHTMKMTWTTKRWSILTAYNENDKMVDKINPMMRKGEMTRSWHHKQTYIYKVMIRDDMTQNSLFISTGDALFILALLSLLDFSGYYICKDEDWFFFPLWNMLRCYTNKLKSIGTVGRDHGVSQ